MNSVWLREEEEDWDGMKEEGVLRGRLRQHRNLDPILGFNLEGQSSIFKKGESLYTLMDHGSEDTVLTLEEGKKRTRGKLKWMRQGLEVDYVWLGVGISVSDFKAIPKVILMCLL
ncbi:hypothetical protein Golob_023921, partial [Gossypium lobatum]|nr:hypothetical protein [Gossypium lobatum]